MICVYQDPGTDFNTSDYVQRAVNDISFCAKKNEVFPAIFQLADNVFLHVCLSKARTEACHLFDIMLVNYGYNVKHADYQKGVLRDEKLEK